VRSVLSFYHDQACGGYFNGRKTAAKFFNVVSTSALYLEMFLNTVGVALGANNWVG